MSSSKNIESHWRYKVLSIGFIVLVVIKISKNLRMSLIMISKKDAYVDNEIFLFMIKTQKLLFQKGYKKLKSSFV